MWRWLPAGWRVPLWVKISLLILLVMTPYLLLPQRSLDSVRQLAGDFQSARLQQNVRGLADLLGNEARRLQENIAGISRAKSVAENWSAYRLAVDEASAGRLQGNLQDALEESREIAGLDFLAMASPRSDLYLANGRAPNYGLEIPTGTLLRTLAAQQYEAILPTRPADQWRWTIEYHPRSEPEGGGPFLMVGGPVYLQDFDDTYRLAGVIVGGKNMDEGILGNPGDTADTEPTQVMLAERTGDAVWSTLSLAQDADDVLQELSDAGMLQHVEAPVRLELSAQPYLATVFDLQSLPEQKSHWERPLLLIATQPESQSAQLLSQFQQGFQAVAWGSAVLAILLALVFTAGLSRPLQALAAAAERFAQGDASIPVEVPQTRDEVESLGAALSTMIGQREEATARIIRAEKLASWRDVARKLAHEIKNPLQPIRLQVESLARTAQRHPEKVADMMPEASEIVLFEVDRLKRLADDFAEFARMPKPLLEPTPLAPLIERVVHLVQTEHPAIDYQVSLPAQLPYIALDQEKITQVLMNLLKNGAEALESGEFDDALIACSASLEDDGGVIVMVSDNGPGMPPEILDQLFTPYYTTKEQGTGLGLVVVQQVMGEHGGEVLVNSEVGSGTTFTLYFPPTLRVDEMRSNTTTADFD